MNNNNNEGFFDINEFKKWMEEDPSNKQKRSKFIGIQVESKISSSKLVNKIETENEIDEVVEDFIENGGFITNVEGNWFTVEVNSGDFIVPRKYVRRS